MVYVALQQHVALALKDSEASVQNVLALDSATSVELSTRARYAASIHTSTKLLRDTASHGKINVHAHPVANGIRNMNHEP